MNKFLVKNLAKALVAALLVVVMWIFQYYPEQVDFKFWLGLIVVLGILIYLIGLVISLSKKIVNLQKEAEKEPSIEENQK
ncbi:MAG: hypothetical protein U0L53_03415 [Bacteroidales bacterium]|nr:hypothetical protein [Bacteroidales bacterium]